MLRLLFLAARVASTPVPIAVALFWEDETDEALVHDMRERFVGRLSILPHELSSDDVDSLRTACAAKKACTNVPVPGVVISDPRRASSAEQLSVADFVSAVGVEAFSLGRGAKLKDLYRFLERRAGEAQSPAAMWRSSRMESVDDFQRLCALREGLCVVLFASSAADAPWALLGDALRGFAPQNEAFSLMWAESYSTLHAELNIALPTTPSIAVIEPRRKKVAVLALNKDVDAPTARRWLQKFDILQGEYQDAFYADVPPFASPLQDAAPSSIRRQAA